MYKSRPGPVLVFCLLVAMGFLLALLLPIAYASEQMPLPNSGGGDLAAPLAVEGVQAPVRRQRTATKPAVAQTVASTTTLEVAIHSSPVAASDHNKPIDGPRIFVVHAVVTNTGPVAATALVVSLDYQEDPANDWILAPGENPERTQVSLTPGGARHSYWFASYPAQAGLSHQYRVTASAANAAAVSTTDNVFGNPEPGATVKTGDFRDTGNNGQVALSSDVVVGVSFTMTVDYELVTNPQGLILSPAGNLDFDSSTVQLRDVSVRFHDSGVPQQEITVEDQLYFPTLPELPNGSTPESAEVTYTFLTLEPGPNILCPYAGVQSGTPDKYDIEYCEGNRRATITGTLTFDFVKEVSELQVQEGQRLTYTLHYTNTGTLPLNYAWIWDKVDPQVGEVVTSTIAPAPNAAESNDNLVAWNLGPVQPGISDTVTFAILVDGPAGADLMDGQTITNTAFFGINEGALPLSAAVTRTVTSTVMAPTIVAAKTDGLTTVQDGQTLTYTITASNEGSLAAVGLSALDVLPDEVAPAGAPSPPATGQTGQTLFWDSLGDLAPGETLTVTVPVSVAVGTPSFTSIVNEFLLSFRNPAGHLYQTKQVTDSTTVIRQAAFVEGFVFEDANADGILDPGESGLAGVQLSLPGAYTPTVSTDSTGFYRFRVESENVFSLTETDPSGYVSTTPNRVAVNTVLGETYQVNFGDMPAGGGSSPIYGTVFADQDGDAVWDRGEAGIPGVTVELDGSVSTTTDAYGSFSFGAVAPGLHTVEETDPAGYLSTTPNRVGVTAVAGQDYEVNFGDMPAGGDSATIYGTIFADEDGDAVWDSDEAGIPGVTVTLDGSLTTTTDANGSYSFGAVAPGQHSVEQTDLPDYVSTTPNRVDVIAVADESYEVNFGDMPPGSGSGAVHGTVFADQDGDGVWDGDEAGIAGVALALDGGVTTTTDARGSYSFGAVAPGQHTVVETDLPNYFSTTSNTVTLTVQAENAYTVNFGDVLLGTGACAPDDYEDDDTPALAKPLGAGVVADHDFCDTDTADWHAFTVERGDLYAITTAALGLRTDTVLRLYDKDGVTLLAENDDYAGTTNFSSQIVWEAPDSGTYFIRISNRAGLSEWLTGYDVWIERQDNHYLWLPVVAVSTTPGSLNSDKRLSPAEFSGKLATQGGPSSPTGVIDHCDPDAFEVDDTWELAQSIVPGVTQTHTFDSDPDLFAVDKDFVMLDIGPEGSLTATSNSTTVSTLLELYDANGQALNRSGVDELEWSDPPTGRYYLGVTPVSPTYSCDGSVSYELTVEYTPLYRALFPAIMRR